MSEEVPPSERQLGRYAATQVWPPYETGEGDKAMARISP